jgi:DUF1680 family protein
MTGIATPLDTTPKVGAGILPVAPSAGRLRPLGLDEVRVGAGFWGAMITRNRDHTIPHILRWLEKAGWLGNFDAAVAGTLPRSRRGRVFSDSEIYKALESIAWQLAVSPDSALEDAYHDVVRRVAEAQEPDGYLSTSFGRPGQPPRYSDLEWGHELYCYGHLLQAATARLRSGYDDELVDVARAVAEHVCATFGPDGIQRVCGHPEIELGLAEFGRATGERRYLEQAALFVDRRGRGTLADIEWGRSYFQDDVPFREATSLRGHAVRALYLAAGAVDVAVETADDELLAAAIRQWSHAVARRTYLTGGMGSRHQDEGFGDDFSLPPDRAYSETCAGVASVMLSWRLLLATGDPAFADLAERTLYNVVAASPDVHGTAFFYTNTLHQRVPAAEPEQDTIVPRSSGSMRAPWFEVSCCPPNVARTLASLGAYLATKDASGIQLHQYTTCDISTTLDDGSPVHLQVETDYPRSGSIRIRSLGPAAASWTLTLRVPAWAGGATITDRFGTRPTVPGTVAITDEFQPGTTITLDLPMVPHFTIPNPRVDAVRSTAAVERGPMVLCLESTDLPPGSDLAGLRVSIDADLIDTTPPDAGTVEPWVTVPATLTAPVDDETWPYHTDVDDRSASVESGDRITVGLIPYFQWANRGPSTMRVWIPTEDPGAIANDAASWAVESPTT